MLLDESGHMFNHDRRRQYSSTGTARESGDRSAPDTLSGQTPVRTIGNHAFDPIPPPWRHPLDPSDFSQGLTTQVVGLHRHEPLFRCAKNDGLLASPAMRVGVIQRTLTQ